MARQIEAVLFDCDGLLVDSEILAAEIELEYLASAGLNYEPAAFRKRFMGMPNPAFFAAIDADAEEQLGRPLGADFFKAMKAKYRDALRDRLQPVAGALDAVNATSLPKAVASSSDPDHLALKLQLTGFTSLFGDHVYPAALVERGKPEPDLFYYAADRLNAKPETCVVLEDSVNGIKAAKAAGMLAVGILAGRHLGPDDADLLTQAGADYVFSDFEPYKALILKRSTT